MKKTQHEYSGDVQDVRIVAELDNNSIYNHLWQPYIANLGGNHLVCAYGAHFRGKQDIGDIYASVSEDGGDTWHPPVLIFDHRNLIGGCHYGYLNPSFIQVEGTETLWCFATRSPKYKFSGDDNELVAAYSVDGGWSWQQIPLACDFWSPLITCNAPVPIVRDGYTRYLMPVHRGPYCRGDLDADQRAFNLESGDLIHWKIGAYVPFDESDPVYLAEGSLVQRKENLLTLMFRTAKYARPTVPTECNCAYRSESTDGGKTWSAAQPEKGCHNTWSKSWYYIEEDGTEVYIYSPGGMMERPGLDWVRKQPGATSWNEPRVFYDGGNRNSYPTFVTRDGGGWNAVWDSSKDMNIIRTRICFGIFDSRV